MSSDRLLQIMPGEYPKLSRDLDGLLMQQAPFEEIVDFMKFHKSNIPKILRCSVFGFDMFDLFSDPMRRFDKDILVHRYQIGVNDGCFALVLSSQRLDLLNQFKGRLPRSMEELSSMRVDQLKLMDIALFSGLIDIQEYFNTILGDESRLHGMSYPARVREFVDDSWLARSILKPRIFSTLDKRLQTQLCRTFISDSSMWKLDSRYWKLGYAFEVRMSLWISLARQSLMLGDVDTFNCLIDNTLPANMNSMFGCSLESMAWKLLPSFADVIVRNMADYKTHDVAGLVFDIILHENEFNVVDAFLFMYCISNSWTDALKSSDLSILDELNLPFDYTRLTKFQSA